MRDYTYIGSTRFSINNVFRSKRYDLDRLDANWVEAPKPEFVRGYRIVDHQEFNTVTVHGKDADDIAYSMAYINYQIDGEGSEKFDDFLGKAIQSKNYLYVNEPQNQEKSEELLH